MHVKFELPNYDCRVRLWKMCISKKIPTNLNAEEISKQFEGLSSSNISNAVINAAFRAARRDFVRQISVCVKRWAGKILFWLSEVVLSEKNRTL